VVTRAAARLIDIRPDRGIHIAARGGTLTGVSVTTGAGRRVPGHTTTWGRAWNSTWALAPAQAYHVTATAVNRAGRTTAATGTFTTLRPRHTFSVSTPLGGNPVDMNSATYGVMPGDPGYYNVLVYDSVKFTASGDYIHSAPWSVGEQGFANVSHGCVNVAPAQAARYYGHSLLGDPITIVGSPLRGTWGDGWTIWFLSWRKLVAGSATGQAVLASRGGRFVPALTLAPSRDHLRVLTP
jgi:Bacterial Ig domain/L,D-transpeptidase catalytic domain